MERCHLHTNQHPLEPQMRELRPAAIIAGSTSVPRGVMGSARGSSVAGGVAIVVNGVQPSTMNAPMSRHPRRTAFGILLSGHHVSEQGIDLLLGQHAAPRRHAILPISDRVEEAAALVCRKGAQVEEAAAGIVHPHAVADRAMVGVEFRTGGDLLCQENER
jgi:hypothetical protein